MNILIKNVLLDGKRKDVLIEGNLIKEIGSIDSGDKIIDGSDKAIIPGLVNGHTHAAMTLLRGYADDMKVMDWLNTKIWPIEGRMTEEDVYWGSKLACLEMIKSGTTFFNDMYFFKGGGDAIQAAVESGIRMMTGHAMLDFDPVNREKEWQIQRDLTAYVKNLNNPRITVAINPHSIYTVSKESLLWCKEFADKNNLMLHIHLSESKKEVDDCIKQNGKRPVEYLNDIGFLGPNIIAAHVIWVNDNEIELLKKNNVKVVHNPVSNMKLSSGVLPYTKMKEMGLTISLGTDGCASNNNLDMLEEMKVAALLQKLQTNDPTVLPAADVFQMATNGSVFGLNYGVKVGCLADVVLIDLKKAYLVPNHNLISNLVYAAKGDCVDTVIIDGKVVMENGKVEGEEEILKKVEEVAKDLIKRGNER